LFVTPAAFQQTGAAHATPRLGRGAKRGLRSNRSCRSPSTIALARARIADPRRRREIDARCAASVAAIDVVCAVRPGWHGACLYASA